MTSRISLKKRVMKDLEGLSETELMQVSDYLAFLKFRERFKLLPNFDESQLDSWRAEFADEDRALAEEGMEDYFKGLAREDKL
jgi:hypothetical protein